MNAYAGRNGMAFQGSHSHFHYFEDESDYIPQPEVARPHLFARIGAALRWLADLPRRQAVMDELASLSDHELADIGLTRADLPRVFDADFAAEHNGQRFAKSDVAGRPVSA